MLARMGRCLWEHLEADARLGLGRLERAARGKLAEASVPFAARELSGQAVGRSGERVLRDGCY